MSNYKNNREKNWKQTTWLKIIKKKFLWAAGGSSEQKIISHSRSEQ